MTRLICLSDTHTMHEDIPIPDGDILIHAGDLTGRGNYHEFKGIGKWFESLKDRFKHRIIIAGNHDFGFEFNRRVILDDHFDKDIIYLQDEAIELLGIKFYGTPWTPSFYNWAFMDDDDDLAKRWKHIPDNTEVLITHSPPYSILDKNDMMYHCGSRSLYERVKKLLHLKHHIFGHIHHSYGTEAIANTVFHNVCSLDERYIYKNPPQVIEL